MLIISSKEFVVECEATNDSKQVFFSETKMLIRLFNVSQNIDCCLFEWLDFQCIRIGSKSVDEIDDKRANESIESNHGSPQQLSN